MPQLGRNIRSYLTHDTVLEARSTCPTPIMLWKDGRAQIDAKLKRYRCRRHTTWTGQIISAPECQTVTGTDAAATVLPDLAHHRIPTLHTMIRNGSVYDPQPSAQLPAAA